MRKMVWAMVGGFAAGLVFTSPASAESTGKGDQNTTAAEEQPMTPDAPAAALMGVAANITREAMATDDMAERGQLLEEALEVLTDAIGPDALDVAWSHCTLAEHYRDVGDDAAADPHFARCHAIRAAHGQDPDGN